MEWVDKHDGEAIELVLTDPQWSIPSMVDGLNSGQRKILFSSFKRNFVKEAKVALFSGYVSAHSSYHPGEQSLSSTIIGMAQDYVGSNNINLLMPNGQFGTRNRGGKDHASACYTYTKLSPITRFLFPKDDDVLLDYLNEDGKKIEPTWFMPIIPMVLVNGSEGIGTGWSSYIPNYNPRDIVANIRRLLDGEEMEPMNPWYRGFKGTIERSMKEGGASYSVSGTLEEVNETTIRITELPVRRWTKDYKEFLESISLGNKNAEDPFIEGFTQHSNHSTVDILVHMPEETLMAAKQEGLFKKLKLTTTISTSNMHLFDSNGVIKKYDTPEQILEEFFYLRIEFYEKRKKMLLENLEMELLVLENKVRFMLGVKDGEINVFNREIADLNAELQQKGYTPLPDVAEDNGYNYNYLLSMPIQNMTLENEQFDERSKMKDAVEELRKATPKSLWNKDLDELDQELDELDKNDAQSEEGRKKSIGQVKKTSKATQE